MSGWMVVVIIAIVMSGLVKIFTGRHPHPHASGSQGDTRLPGMSAEDASAARREIADLRERVRVLERIATDSNTVGALESRRIEQEIEALRDRQKS